MHGCMDGCTDGWVHKWKDGLDAWVDGQMDGRAESDELAEGAIQCAIWDHTSSKSGCQSEVMATTKYQFPMGKALIPWFGSVIGTEIVVCGCLTS